MDTVRKALKESMVVGLMRACAAHEEGRLLDIGDGLAELKFPGEVSRGTSTFDCTLNTAWELWDTWAEEAEHGFPDFFGRGIRVERWPIMARTVVEDLQNERPITDRIVLAHFQYRPQKSLTEKFREMVGLKRKDDGGD
jgi:hypothetical protein